MTPVHYKGGGETLRTLSGQVKVMFSTPAVLGLVKEGQLRGIATTDPSGTRCAPPDLPTVAESGLAGYDMRLWFGLAAHAGTRARHRPPGGGLKQALSTLDVHSAFAKQGYEPLHGTPEEFGAFYGSEADKWKKIIDVVGSIGG